MVGAGEGAVDHAVDHHMGDVDAVGADLAGETLGQLAQGSLGPGEGRESCGPARRGGGSGEQDRAPAAGHHDPGRLATGEEAGQGRHLPDLGIDLGRGLEHGKPDIGPDVEDHDL